MTSVADRTRAAMDAITAQVDSAPPLPLPPPAVAGRRRRAAPAPRRWAPWLAPAAAAAAVIALAVSLVIVRDAGRPTPPASPAAVPRYYVALPGYDQIAASEALAGQTGNYPPVGAQDAIVGDTFSGKQLTSLPAPAGWKFVSVTAAADDRTFIVGAYKTEPPRLPTATRWYLIRLTPGSAGFATMRELPIPEPSGFIVTLTALSPDGTILALGNGLALWTYSTRTGALLHTWSSSQRGAEAFTELSSLSWTSDGRQLAFETSGLPGLGFRLLRSSDPGHDLLGDSRLAWSMPAPPIGGHPTARRPFGCSGVLDPSVLVAGDGTTVVCGASGVFRQGNFGASTCPGVPAWNDEGVLEYSTATGKVTRTLYRTQSNCMPGPGPVQLLWTSDSGDAAIGYFEFTNYSQTNEQNVIRFGLFTAGKFTPLPAPPTIPTGPAFTAW